MPDSLEAAMGRESILLAGDNGTGKSFSIACLAKQGLEEGFNLVIMDGESPRLAKSFKEVLGKVPDNVDYFAMTSWQKYEEATAHALANLGPGDWLVMEQIGNMWEHAQAYFAEQVYGVDPTDHLMVLRADAEAEIQAAKARGASPNEYKERQKATGYNGFEGRTDWPLIKRMHNQRTRDRLIQEGAFSILSTSNMDPLREEEAHKYPKWSALGRRPRGEKGNEDKHDTLAVVERKNNKFLWRTDMGNGKGKDCLGRLLVRDIDFTDQGFITSYLEYHQEV